MAGTHRFHVTNAVNQGGSRKGVSSQLAESLLCDRHIITWALCHLMFTTSLGGRPQCYCSSAVEETPLCRGYMTCAIHTASEDGARIKTDFGDIKACAFRHNGPLWLCDAWLCEGTPPVSDS